MDTLPVSLKAGADHGQCRTLAVGAGKMNNGRNFAFRMIKIGKQALRPVQCQIDALGIQRFQPIENQTGIGVGHCCSSVMPERALQ